MLTKSKVSVGKNWNIRCYEAKATKPKENSEAEIDARYYVAEAKAKARYVAYGKS